MITFRNGLVAPSVSCWPVIALVSMSNRMVLSLLDGGGADTLHSAMNRFFAVMALYPDVQRNGREEIDRVIGRSRLPTIQEYGFQ
jgi:hypothetical protein